MEYHIQMKPYCFMREQQLDHCLKGLTLRSPTVSKHIAYVTIYSLKSKQQPGYPEPLINIFIFVI